MLILFVVAILLSLAALVTNIMLIVRGFKQSAGRGIFTVVALALLAGSISCSLVIYHRTKMAEVGAKEVQEKGQQEFEDKKNELDDLENLEL